MKKLLYLILTLLVVVGMAGAGTFAYFSDTETSSGNTFTMGTLDFTIYDPPAAGHQVFNISNMAPGDVKTGYIAVVNDGTLNCRWRAYLTGWDSGTLDDVLDVKVTLHPTGYDYTALTGAGYTIAGPSDLLITDWTAITNLGDGNTILLWDTPAGPFEPKWAGVYKLEVRMRETAGNTYQGATFTGDLNFSAAQW